MLIFLFSIGLPLAIILLLIKIAIFLVKGTIKLIPFLINLGLCIIGIILFILIVI